MKQAFFFDIDGTLYQNKFHWISPAVMQALKDLIRQDYPIYLVTSRSIHELQHLPKSFLDLPFSGWILEGGALVLDENRNPIDVRPLDEADTRRILEYADAHDLGFRYSTVKGNYFGRPPKEEHRWIMNQLYLCAPEYKEWQGDEALNILVWTSGKEAEELKALVPDCSIVQYPDCLEIRSKDASKEGRVKEIRRKNRYSRIYAFGDGANDAAMLEMANVGIAMDNGCNEVKAAADVITGSVEEDGVVQYLAEMNFIRPRRR